MAGLSGLAFARALESPPEKGPRLGYRRVPSMNRIDIMKPIPEGGVPSPSPNKSKRVRQFSFRSSLRGQEENMPLLKSTQEQLVEEKDEKSREEEKQHRWRIALNVFLTIVAVLAMIVQVVSAPLYYDEMSDTDANSDPFIASFLALVWLPAIFFLITFLVNGRKGPREAFLPSVPFVEIFAAGVLAGFSNILVSFSSLPDRTPPYLQPILQQILIPSTAIARFLILKKGISGRQVGCILLLFLGITFTLLPSFLRMRDETGEERQGHGVWYCILTYALAWLPLSLGYALIERGQKSDEVKSLTYTAWFQLFELTAYFFFFWLDFIPNFGMAAGGHPNFTERLENGFLCFFGSAKACQDAPKLAIVFIISSAVNTLFAILLIHYAEGAVYIVVAQAVVTPASILFWSLFAAQPSLHWAPIFDTTTVMIMVGLAITIPAVVLYMRLGPKDSVETEIQTPSPPRMPRRSRSLTLPEIPQRPISRSRTFSAQHGVGLGLGLGIPPPARRIKKPQMRRVKSDPVIISF